MILLGAVYPAPGAAQALEVPGRPGDGTRPPVPTPGQRRAVLSLRQDDAHAGLT